MTPANPFASPVAAAAAQKGEQQVWTNRGERARTGIGEEALDMARTKEPETPAPNACCQAAGRKGV